MNGSADPFQQAMNAGHSAAWDGLWEQAVRFYRQALEISPNHPRALNSLALGLYELQDYEASLHAYVQVARAAPEEAPPVEKIAQLYERLGKIDRAIAAALQAAELYLKSREVDKAIENWNRALQLNPEQLQARSRLALVYERLGKQKEAIAEYIHIASLLQAAGDLEKAYQTLQHALQVFPGDGDARRALELLQEGRALPRPARPSGSTAPLRMAQVRQMEGPPEEAGAESSQDPVREARGKALTALAGMLFDVAEGEPEAASTPRRGLGSIVRSVGGRTSRGADQTLILLHLSQVVDLQTQGQSVQAAEELERAVDAGLNHPAAAYDLGLLWSEQERQVEALGALQRAVKHPDFALGSHLLLGQTLGKLGRWKEASIEYLEALRLADAAGLPEEQAEDLRQLYEPIIEAQKQSSDPAAQQGLCENVAGLLLRPAWREHLGEARQQLPIGNAAGAPVPLAEILTQSRSSQVVESITRIHQLANAGYLQSAMEEAYYALQQAPTYLPLHVYMGELLLKQNRLTDAVAKLLIVARTYSIRGESRRAIDLYRRVIALAPMDLNARTRLIDLLVTLNKYEEALQEYLGFADVYYDLADLDLARKALTEALQLAQGSRVDRSWRVRLLHRMADIDLQRLDWRQALRLFEQIRNLQPDDEKARQKLVEINDRLGQESQALSELDNFLAFLGSSGQHANAASFLERLLHDHRDRPSIRRRLGEVYAQMGRSAEAIAQFDTAGEKFLEAGDRASAAGMVEAILMLNPPHAAEYQKLLAQIKSR